MDPDSPGSSRRRDRKGRRCRQCRAAPDTTGGEGPGRTHAHSLQGLLDLGDSGVGLAGGPSTRHGVGSGAGAGITAELLTRAGLKVVIVEEGPLKSSADFNQQEAIAYPSLYQESAARKTEDKAINILQGRCVGGSTTVN